MVFGWYRSIADHRFNIRLAFRTSCSNFIFIGINRIPNDTATNIFIDDPPG